MSPLDTEEWQLSAFIDWKRKKPLVTHPCEYCNGRGKVGGGFKSLDGPQDCPECFGTRVGRTEPGEPRPEIPEALIDHMRKAWQQYFKGE
jgi:hypothetical protein